MLGKIVALLALACALSGGITITTQPLASGAVQVTIEVPHVAGAHFLTRTFAASDEAAELPCNPYLKRKTANLFDRLDSFGDADANSAASRLWSFADSADGSRRTYRATFAPLRLRQQFSDPQAQPGLLAGNVIGGAVPAKIRACVFTYGRQPTGVDMQPAVEIVASAGAEIVARDGAAAADVNVVPLVRLPVAVGENELTVILNTETRSVSDRCDETKTPYVRYKSATVEFSVGNAVAATVVEPEPECIVSDGSNSACKVCRQTFVFYVPKAGADALPNLVSMKTMFAMAEGNELHGDVSARFNVPLLAEATRSAAKKAHQQQQLPPQSTLAAPKVEPQQSAAAVASAPATSAASAVKLIVESGGKATSSVAQRRNAPRSGDDAAIDDVYATIFFDKQTCFTMTLPPGSPGVGNENARIVVESATVKTAKLGSVALVHKGAVTRDAERSVKAHIASDKDRTSLCFVSKTGSQEAEITVEAIAMTKKQLPAEPAREVVEPQAVEEISPLKKQRGTHAAKPRDALDPLDVAEWCSSEGNCTAIFVVHTVIECAGDTHYDAELGMCVSPTQAAFRETLAYYWFVPMIVGIVVVLVGILICAILHPKPATE